MVMELTPTLRMVSKAEGYHLRSARILSLVVAALLVWLGVSHLELLHAFRTGEHPQLAAINPLDTELAEQQRARLREIRTRQEMLEYMVWPREQSRLRAELGVLLQQTQNMNPARAEHWLAMLALQDPDVPPDAARLWELGRAIQFNVWNPKQRTLLAQYCASYLGYLPVPLLTRCESLLKLDGGRAQQRRRVQIELEKMLERFPDTP